MERGVIFQLDEGEKVIDVIRRHWIAFLIPSVVTFIMLLIFIIGMIFLLKLTGGSDASVNASIGRGLILIIGSMYLLSLIAYFYISWLDYYLDIFIITNQRIIRLEQIVLFGRKISKASFHHIQDASSSVKGAINSILDVGTLFVETAGERENFSFQYVRNPNSIASKILDLQEKVWEEEGIKNELIFPGPTISPQKKEAKKQEEEEVQGEVRREEKEKPASNYQKMLQGQEAKDSPEIKKEPINKEEKVLEKDDIELASPKITEEINLPEKKEEEEVKEDKDESTYRDGRKIIEEGVIWQADQEATPEIIDTLNEMEK